MINLTPTATPPKQLKVKGGSIQQKAVLVALTIKAPPETRQDVTIDNDIQQLTTAVAGNFKLAKKLFPKDFLRQCKKILGKARNDWYYNTVPWDDRGWRLLPVANHLNLSTILKNHKDNLETAVKELKNKYETILKDAPNRLGKLYDARDYPDPEAFVKEFALEWSIKPVPSAGHLVAEISSSDLDEARKEIEAQVEDNLKAAHADLWNRLHDVVKHLAVTLKDPDAKFKNTLVGNVEKLCDLIEPLNLTNDQALSDSAKEIKDALASLDPDQLRTDPTIRSEAAKKAEEQLNSIVNRMQPLHKATKKTQQEDAA